MSSFSYEEGRDLIVDRSSSLRPMTSPTSALSPFFLMILVMVPALVPGRMGHPLMVGQGELATTRPAAAVEVAAAAPVATTLP